MFGDILLQVFGSYSTWISSVYRPIALKFIFYFVLVAGLEFALWYLPKFIERRRADARWEKEREML